MFLVLVLVEVTDIVFAVDSVPAIFAITDEPLVVFTSNICAILGLRAMYFLLASVMDRFHLLSTRRASSRSPGRWRSSRPSSRPR